MTFPKISLDLLMRVLAGVFGILLITTFIGCGGGSNPIAPQTSEEQPVYRLQVVLDQDIIHGGAVVSEVEVEQGTQRRFWVRLESKVGNNPWTIVTQAVQLDVTIEGSASGFWMADIGLTGGQSWALAGQSRLEFQPPIGGHLGTAKLKLSVPEFGAFTYLWVKVTAPATTPPPLLPTCRDLHPDREAINGFWWDCVDGKWQNTGEPVDQPPPPPDRYELVAFPDSSILELREGDIYSFKVRDIEAKAFVRDINGSELSGWTVDPLYPGEEYCISTPGEFATCLNSGPPDYIVISFITPGMYVATATYIYKGVELQTDIEIQVDFMS